MGAEGEALVWRVRSQDTAHLRRRCLDCQQRTEFHCTGKFRMNANARYLDVWLLFKCGSCDTTLKVPVFERRAVSAFTREQIDGFSANDAALVDSYLSNLDFLRAGGFEIQPVEDFVVTGPDVVLTGAPGDVRVLVEQVGRPVRLERVLSRKLGLSRARVERLLRSAGIEPVNGSGPDAAARRLLVIHGARSG